MSEKKSKKQVFGERLFSTLLLWGIVTTVFMSGAPWAFVGLVVVLGCIAAKEYFGMARATDYPAQPIFGLVTSVGYLCLIGYFLASRGREGLQIVESIDGVAIALVMIGLFSLQLRNPLVVNRSLNGVATSLAGFVYLAFMYGFMARLLFLPEGDGVTGAWLIIWVVAVTKFTDMGAYITGSLIGKNKMIPHISPGKTWEGFFGALLWAQLAACGLYALLGDDLAVLSSWNHVIILGFILALLAVVGDLAGSIIKRCFESKDSGKTLPGIGGALDLIDSLCFTAPVVYYYILWVI